MNLYVDIEKNFIDFHLKVKFECGKEILGLLGASGCGKSVTLKCIAGIEKPDKGKIILDDYILFDSDKEINLTPQERHIGYLFQNYALFPNMTVKQNILCGLHNEKNGLYREKIFSQTIELLQLTELLNHRPSQLSGGQAQRTALARILVNRPNFLMLDEPFSALDSHLRLKLQMRLLELLKNYEHGVLMVTHNRNEAYHLCNRIAVIDNGRLLTVKDTKEFFADPETVAAAIISGCKNIVKAKKIGEHEAEISEWNVKLTTKNKIRNGLSAIGIYAHSFDPLQVQNSYEIKFLREMEEPFELVIEFKFKNQNPESEPIWWRIPKNMKLYNFPEKLGISEENILLLY